jgi:regulator of RNase E activity RraA
MSSLENSLAILRQASTGQICDAMDSLGLPRGACSHVLPVARTDVVVGIARTVLFGPTTARAPFQEYMDIAGAGDVLVLANCGSGEVASWGGRRSLTAQARGIVATVIDGGCRDVDEHQALGYAVYSRARTATRGRGVLAPYQTNIPVAFDGVVVAPGDVVVGDVTGVVIIRSDDVDAVAQKTARISEFEKQTAADLRAGRSLADTRRSATPPRESDR